MHISDSKKDVKIKYPRSKNFDAFVSMLERTDKGFSITKLAKQIGCSTERLRRLRQGLYSMDVNDIAVLQQYYGASLQFLVNGVEPMQQGLLRIAQYAGGEDSEDELRVAGEPQFSYEFTTQAQEIIYLKQMLADKERIIKLLEERGKK